MGLKQIVGSLALCLLLPTSMVSQVKIYKPEIVAPGSVEQVKPPTQPALKGKVTLDPVTGDALATYTDLTGQTQNIKWELNRHVKPSVATELHFNEQSSAFRYEYSLRNAPSARQRATLWWFAGMDASGTVTVPDTWQYHFSHNETAHSPNVIPDALAMLVNTGPMIPDEEIGVPPGHTRNFSVESRKLPGLLDVYVQGRGAIPTLPGDAPDFIVSQLAQYTRFPDNYRHTFAIGPKYELASNRETLAKAYLSDLEMLVRAKYAKNDEEFVTKARAILSRVAASLVSSQDWQELSMLATRPLEKEFVTSLIFGFGQIAKNKA